MALCPLISGFISSKYAGHVVCWPRNAYQFKYFGEKYKNLKNFKSISRDQVVCLRLFLFLPLFFILFPVSYLSFSLSLSLLLPLPHSLSLSLFVFSLSITFDSAHLFSPMLKYIKRNETERPRAIYRSHIRSLASFALLFSSGFAYPITEPD